MRLVEHYARSSATFEAPVQESFDATPQENASGISINQLRAIVWFYWRQILLIAFCFILVAMVVIKLLPRTFTATATLIIDSQKRDPLAAPDFADNLLQSYITTQTELILSPIILLPAVDRLHLTNDPKFTAGYSGNSEDARREFAAHTLAGRLAVDLGKGGQLLYITASARTAAAAAELANGVVDVYMEQESQRANAPAAERTQRYIQEVGELRAKVATAQDNLAAFRQERGITSIDSNAQNPDAETQALTNLEQQLLDAQNTRRTLEAKTAGQQGSADESLASPIIQQLKTKLASQRTDLLQLTATEGPQHPQVLELQSQIALTQQQLQEEVHGLSANVSTSLARARELEKRYSQAVADQQKKVVDLRALQGDGAKLELELESAQSVYKRALDGFDQIAFASASNNASVTLLRHASLPVAANKPNKMKLFVGACVFGVLLSLALPLAYELFLNRRVRCRDDLERLFSLPVLAEFDRLPIDPPGAA